MTASPEGAPPPFPGAVGLSHLQVYRSIGPDGLAGGTPHCHTACTEAYAVVAGTGRVQTLAGDGFRRRRSNLARSCGSPRARSTGWSTTGATSRSWC
ncbi:MAG: hypothetical protein WKF43_09785 [Acidimicrobiales bacterium]